MSKKGHAVHVPEDYSNKDMSRAQFARPTGQVGIYVEVNDAEPVDPHAYGSHLYFMREVAERIGQEMKQKPLEEIKGAFERKELLSNAIFEDYKQNNIIAVSFEDARSLSDLWTLHEKDLLSNFVQELFVTECTLKRVGAKSLQLGARMWEDEYTQCQREIKEELVPLPKLETNERDKLLIRNVKKYHPTLAEVLIKLKDALTRFDKTLGEFIMILKQNLPKDVDKISTYNDFLDHVDYVKHRRADINIKVLEGYTKTRQCILESIIQVEDHVVHPLLQVHTPCETDYQRQLKNKMRVVLRETKRQLQSDYDFYRLNHKEWQSKILLREQKLFLGLISVLALSVDTVVDIDAQTDEYMSGLQVKIKV